MNTTYFASLQAFAESAIQKLEAINNEDSLEAWKKEHLGPKGGIKTFLAELKNLESEAKKQMGGAIGAVRADLTEKYENLKEKIATAAQNKALQGEWVDMSEKHEHKIGSIHPLSQTQKEIEDIFSRMGFLIADGPEVETEFLNFDALNIPESHPARDMQDTFWMKKDTDNPNTNFVLRTQTSNAQIRSMQEHGAPLRMICPGRVYRSEDVDATHDFSFYQVEGLMVDENIHLGHLKGMILHMLKEIFKKEVKVRFRPGFFPFVEPGLEVDMWWEYTDKEGNEKGKWLEFMGAGMVHPQVLKNGNIDPEKYTGFAFGFGLTRLVMMQHGIEDIRHLFSNNLDFLRQF